MFRLFRAELKKIFLKPSIFVVTGLIILMLAISTFIYKPDTRSIYTINYNSLSGYSVKQYYNYFTEKEASNAKNYSDNLMTQADAYVNRYADGNNVIEQLINDWRSVEALFDTTPNEDYVSLYSQYQTTDDETQKTSLLTELDIQKSKLKTAITDFQTSYASYARDGSEIYFLVDSKLDKVIRNEHLQSALTVFDRAVGKSDEHSFIISELRGLNIFANVFDDLNQLLPFKPAEELIAQLKTNKIVDGNIVVNEESPIVIGQARLDSIFAEMTDFYDLHKSDSETTPEDRKTIIAYMSEYCTTANYVFRIIESSIKVSGLSTYTAMDITKFKNFEGANYYQLKEILAKTQYLFNTETYEYDYAEPFSVIQPSNEELSGFDYSYFALRLCTFFITIYIVVLAAGTIAGEQSAGTLKLLAIRPYSRNKLLTAKILATLAIGAILLFVSSVASLVVGGVTYGLNFTTVLAVFNASSAFAVSPLILYVIAMFTMLAEVIFYALISIFISTVFKSNIAAVAISILIFFVSLVINVIATDVPLLGLIPFVNVNFFKYFGSAFLANANGNDLIQKILTPTVFSGSTFWSSLILYSLTMIIVIVTTHIIFRKRDIR